MVNERGYGKLGTFGAIDSALLRIKELSGDSLPVAETLYVAHAAGQPVDILGRRYWRVESCTSYGCPQHARRATRPHLRR
jgi:hypothetical protein